MILYTTRVFTQKDCFVQLGLFADLQQMFLGTAQAEETFYRLNHDCTSNNIYHNLMIIVTVLVNIMAKPRFKLCDLSICDTNNCAQLANAKSDNAENLNLRPLYTCIYRCHMHSR